MFPRRDILKSCSLAIVVLACAQGASAQETKTDLFKVVTTKDEIIIGLSTDEFKAIGGSDASAVAHALAQKGDMAVWQYNVHRGANGELQQARPRRSASSPIHRCGSSPTPRPTRSCRISEIWNCRGLVKPSCPRGRHGRA